MKKALFVVSLVLLASSAFGAGTVREISWEKMRSEGKLGAGEVVTRDGMQMLKVTNPGPSPKIVTIATLTNPGIKGPTYAVKGKVVYEGVVGKGYLEMWNIFATGEKSFSRTLVPQVPEGLMKPLEGTSGPRRFVLPFYMGKQKERPTKLILNVVLPGKGTVYVSPLKLEEYREGENPLPIPVNTPTGQVPAGKNGAWWSGQAGNSIGALGGTCLGIIGGLIGMLTSLGRARIFVLFALRFMLIGGALLLLAGAVARYFSQPPAVQQPLLLLGAISTFTSALVLRTASRRYEEMELRRMSAQDAV